MNEHLEELQGICRSIVSQGRGIEDWREVESDDEFQTENFVGGFDATEDAFCFSYYSPEGEQWFQITLEQVSELASGALIMPELRPTE